MISVNNIYKSYTGTEGKQEVFIDASAEFPQNAISAIVGASGSGKSTLLNIIATIDKPDKGEVLYGFNRSKLSTISNREVFRNRHIGFVFQSHNLLPEFTIEENIFLPALIRGLPKNDFLEKANLLMTRCGIIEHKDKRPQKVSGGEAQRAAIARSLINDPDLILADEPTGNLDEQNSHSILDLLFNISRDSGATVLIATHSKDIASRCDKIYTVAEKKISNDSL